MDKITLTNSTKSSSFGLIPWWWVKELITAGTDLRAPRQGCRALEGLSSVGLV
jgi:hypothetical protein